MSKEIGPKERMLREMREARFAKPKNSRPPNSADLRKKVAAIKPAVKGQSGRRGR